MSINFFFLKIQHFLSDQGDLTIHAILYWIFLPEVAKDACSHISLCSQRCLLSDLHVARDACSKISLWRASLTISLSCWPLESVPDLWWGHAFSGLPPVSEWTWQCQPVPTWHETPPMGSLAWDFTIGLWNCDLCLPTQPVLPLFPWWSGMHHELETSLLIACSWSLFLCSSQISPSINGLHTWSHHDICSLENWKWHTILAFIKADLHKQISLSPFYSDKITSR